MRLTATVIIVLAVACSPAQRVWPLACDLVPMDRDDYHIAACAVRARNGTMTVREGAVPKDSFGPEGVAAVQIEGRLYFVSRTGRTAPALYFDNGADYFVEGLARTVRGGKVGFVNSDLSEVVPAQWDFAYPFDRGFAEVCLGCVSKREGEHSVLVGGTWGYIDKTGRVVVPVVHDQHAVPNPYGRER
jgi:hypothetical protein